MQLTLMLVLMYESHGGRSIRLATSFRKSLTSASVSAANVTCTHRRISSAKEVIRYRRRHFVCLLVGRIAKNHSTDFLKVRRRGSTWVTAGLTLRLDDGRAVPRNNAYYSLLGISLIVKISRHQLSWRRVCALLGAVLVSVVGLGHSLRIMDAEFFIRTHRRVLTFPSSSKNG